MNSQQISKFDSETSFFNDIKKDLNENSFSEQITEKNKVIYQP